MTRTDLSLLKRQDAISYISVSLLQCKPSEIVHHDITDLFANFEVFESFKLDAP